MCAGGLQPLLCSLCGCHWGSTADGNLAVVTQNTSRHLQWLSGLSCALTGASDLWMAANGAFDLHMAAITVH